MALEHMGLCWWVARYVNIVSKDNRTALKAPQQHKLLFCCSYQEVYIYKYRDTGWGGGGGSQRLVSKI